MRPMMTILLVGFVSLLPLKTQAQQTQLTLSCQIERAMDVKADRKAEPSESFSAIVHMTQDSIATIEATTEYCFDYVGSFSEQQVYGQCEHTVEGRKYSARLMINRINGTFEYDFTSIGPGGIVDFEQWGHCTPGKKLF